ncbi:MAG: hypothetical protein WBO55_17935 [Rhizobiaceae bacterium]
MTSRNIERWRKRTGLAVAGAIVGALALLIVPLLFASERGGHMVGIPLSELLASICLPMALFFGLQFLARWQDREARNNGLSGDE